jgi:tetratricopeptide (TPR) repeat protein
MKNTPMILAVTMATTLAASAAPAADSTATPLTAEQLFSPVRAQITRGSAAVKPTGSVQADVVWAALAAGRVDDAYALLHRIDGDPRQVTATALQVLIAKQDFVNAKQVAERMGQRKDPNTAERVARYSWLFATDDAAAVDRLTRGHSLAPGTKAPIGDLLAAGKLAYDLLNYPRAESCFTRVLEATAKVTPFQDSETKLDREARVNHGVQRAARATALRGMGQVLHKRRDYDGSLQKLGDGAKLWASPDLMLSMAETLIRLGRTDDAITAGELAVKLGPYHDGAHYLLGNGYARKTYTELEAAYPRAFAGTAGRGAFARADRLRASGDRKAARMVLDSLRKAQPGWADVRVRIASLDFEEGWYELSRDHAIAALAIIPDYGRAHAVLAKALELQRFMVDVHRHDYERKFSAAATPSVPGIEKFVVNWSSLSPRHQKRVALSIAPWKQYVPVLIEGGSTYYIKPLHELLSESPGLETLRDTRIDYDSRLWDDVRGAGGYNTVTGIEDVERTIFDRYNTVLHELSHQVHGVMTADQSREIQEHYRRAKAHDDTTQNGFMSRYAGGSVHEYFAEGANALYSPKRDTYDPREVVLERMKTLDPPLDSLMRRMVAITDVTPSYPVAYVNAGDDQVYRGKIDTALPFYSKALAHAPKEETALRSMTSALTLKGDQAGMISAGERARAAHPTSGSIVTAAAEALWRGGRGLDAAIQLLDGARATVRPEDRYLVDQSRGQLRLVRGDAGGALAAFDSVLAYQSDNPEGLWGRASALAEAGMWNQAFPAYDKAVRMRTGIASLRCDYARDLIRAGRLDSANVQLDEAKLLDPEYPTAEALRGWLALERGQADSAKTYAERAIAWGEWSDLAHIVLSRAHAKLGNAIPASAALDPVRQRIESGAPPAYVYRSKLSSWESIHELPAWERALVMASSKTGGAHPPE